MPFFRKSRRLRHQRQFPASSAPARVSEGLERRLVLSASCAQASEQCLAIEFDSSLSTDQPVIRWNNLPDVSRYEIWGSNLTTNEVAGIRDTQISSNKYVPNVPLKFGKHRFWVRGFDADDIPTPWSAAYDYSVGPEQLSPVTPGFNRRPTFDWSTIEGAVAYDLYIRTSTSVLQPQQLSETSWTPAEDLPPGSMRWWVRGITENGRRGPWSSVVEADIARPIVLSPTDIATESSPRIEWTEVTGAAHYSLFVSRIDVPGLVMHKNQIETRHFDMDLLVDGRYRVWVQPTDASGEKGYWSRPEDFIVAGGIPTRPVTPGELVRESRQEFQWEPVADADAYVIRAWAVNYGSQYELQFEEQVTTNSWTPSSDLLAGNWAWSIEALRENEEPIESARWPFYVTPQVSVQVDETGRHIVDVTDGHTPDAVWGAEIYVDRQDSRDVVLNEVIGGYFRQLALPALSQGDYRAWVRILENPSHPSPWTRVTHFSIEADDISTLPVSPLETVYAEPTTFVWQPTPAAIAYDFYIHVDGHQFGTWIANIEGTSITTDQVSLTTPSYWQIRPRFADEVFGEWSERVVVQPIGPTMKPIESTQIPVRLEWSATEGVSKYEVDVRFRSNIIVEGTTLELNTPLRDGAYTVRVRALRNGESVGRWSEFESFQIEAASNIEAPRFAETVNTFDLTPTLNWNPVDDAESYELAVWRGNNILLTRRQVEFQFTFEEPIPEGQYFWAVRSIDAAGNAGGWNIGRGLNVGSLNFSAGIRSVFYFEESATLITSGIDGADLYTVYVEDSERNVLFRRDVGIDEFEFTLTNQLRYTIPYQFPTGNFRVWLQAWNSENGMRSRWSSPRAFTVT